MTSQHCEDFMAVSEELPYYHYSEPALFSEPAEVEDWRQSILLSDGQPLTPPDTISECATSDCQDMPSQAWSSRASLPDEAWSAGPTSTSADNSTSVSAPPRREWLRQQYGHLPAMVPVIQDPSVYSATAPWKTVQTDSGVDMGSSPALSFESQSTHVLTSLSEPAPLVLPLSSYGVPFGPSDRMWPTNMPDYYGCQCTPVSVAQGPYLTPMHGHACYGPHVGVYPATPNAAQPSAYIQAPMSYPQVQYQAPQPRRIMPYPAHRPILPRTEGYMLATQPVYGMQRLLRPHVTTSQSSPSVLSSVSSLPRQAQGALQAVTTAEGATIRPLAQAGSVAPLAAGSTAPQQAISLTSEVTLPPASEVPVPYVGDHPEDWSSFIEFDLDEQSEPPHNTSLSTNVGSASVAAADGSMGLTQTHVPRVEVETNAGSDVPSTEDRTLSGESDEGRHRTHPLYNEKPKPDGLYHCPFEREVNCQHSPTKLKCNYDKFIDSHIKPFRCKVEECSNQAFSSTACLLRHEREAHGMHGHGAKPHLCFYPGCDRGVPGKGFPRKYNLFDHMRRVHDYKDDQSPTLEGFPRTGQPVIERRNIGRKRKAPGTLPQEVESQRRRTESTAESKVPAVLARARPAVLQPPAPLMSADGGAPGQAGLTDQRQRIIYSQLDNKREHLIRQIKVQNPDDEVSLQRLSRQFEDFRRLSEEARRS